MDASTVRRPCHDAAHQRSQATVIGFTARPADAATIGTVTGTRQAAMTAIDLHTLLDAVEYRTAGGDACTVEAWICMASGRLLFRDDASDGQLYWSRDLDDRAGVPDDPDDQEAFVPVPSRRDLDLGRALALRYVARHLPDDYDTVELTFRSPGAYARFKHLLDQRDRLQDWFAFEQAAVEQELREWCEAVGIELREPPPAAEPT